MRIGSKSNGRSARCSTVTAGIAMTWVLTMAAAADEIKLQSGDTLNGAITARTASQITVEHPVLGTLTIPAASIATVNGEAYVPPAAGEELPAGEAPPAEEAKEWSSQFKAGGSASFGNTDTQSASIIFTTTRETERLRTAIDAAYFYGATDGDRTTNKFTTGILHDWLIPDSPWLYFADARFDYDEFQTWEYRLAGHLGAGYEFVKEDDFDLTGRIGAGAAKEFNSDDEDVRPEGLVGIGLNWKITDKQQFHFDSTLYPDLGDLSEYRVVTNADWSVLIDEEASLSFFAGLRHEYQSDVAPGFEKSDLYITAGLQIDW